MPMIVRANGAEIPTRRTAVFSPNPEATRYEAFHSGRWRRVYKGPTGHYINVRGVQRSVGLEEVNYGNA